MEFTYINKRYCDIHIEDVANVLYIDGNANVTLSNVPIDVYNGERPFGFLPGKTIYKIADLDQAPKILRNINPRLGVYLISYGPDRTMEPLSFNDYSLFEAVSLSTSTKQILSEGIPALSRYHTQKLFSELEIMHHRNHLLDTHIARFHKIIQGLKDAVRTIGSFNKVSDYDILQSLNKLDGCYAFMVAKSLSSHQIDIY